MTWSFSTRTSSKKVSVNGDLPLIRRIGRVDTPGVALETMWFTWGVGFVRNQGYWNGSVDWRDELQSFSITSGSGYMPVGIGNTWEFVAVPVANENPTWGEIKSMYR